MPRRELLTAAQREALLAFPEEEENLPQYYVLSSRPGGRTPTSVIDQLRSKQVTIPPLSVIERLCAEAITRAER